VTGSFDFEGDGGLATCLAWLIPWGRPVVLLADTPERIAAAQRELTRAGIDRPAAAATGDPAGWIREGEAPASFPCATSADLAGARERGGEAVVFHACRESERAGGHVEDSARIPVHALHGRIGEVPDGTVGVHCSTGTRAAIAASLLDAAERRVVAVDDGFDTAVAAGPTTSRC
jgi:rhodanese-related sulfurtransferase